MNDTAFTPPHSVQAEQAVLGALLLDKKAWDRVSDLLTPEDFYRHDHRLVFQGVKTLAERNHPVDGVTVAEVLEKAGTLEDAGGMVYIGVLTKGSVGSANVETYARIVRERALLRELIEASRETINEASVANRNTDEVVGNAQRRFANISNPVGKGPRRLMDEFKPWLEKLDDRMMRDTKLVGASTGISAIDAAIGGLENGCVYVIAGRPGMAKTTLGLNIAENFAERNETSAVFELEMPHDQLLTRSVANRVKIDSDKVRRGELDKDEWDHLMHTTYAMLDWPLFIDDQAALSLAEIRARCRRLKREHGLALVVIDYLQLIREKAENKVQEITKITQGLKELAKELDVPVVALSQLNRELEKRPNKRPHAADLRDSGSIEQDADVLLFLYREGVYTTDEEFLFDDVAELGVGKQRNGPLSTVYLHYHAAQFRFSNLDETLRRDYIAKIRGAKRAAKAQPRGFEE